MRRKEDSEERYLYPHLLFEIFCVMIIVIEVVYFLAMAFPPAVRRQVDFAFQFSPKPAWYFLPLYELVKYFPGKLMFLGASVVPMILVFFLYAVPWLDKSPERDIRQRRGPALRCLLAALGTYGVRGIGGGVPVTSERVVPGRDETGHDSLAGDDPPVPPDDERAQEPAMSFFPVAGAAVTEVAVPAGLFPLMGR
jgi:quinol-cytochrome oxidoreductase complex cytochrome b subunit